MHEIVHSFHTNIEVTMKLNASFQVNVEYLNFKLEVDQNFDICTRSLMIQNRSCIFYFIDGFVKDEILEKVFAYLLSLKPEDFPFRINDFEKKGIPYTEVELIEDLTQAKTLILSGSVICLIDGYDKALSIDARTYPNRTISEPEDDRVLRGSRDSFVETLVFNTALIRRRIRDEHLRMEIHTIGTKSKTDVVLCYLSDTANPQQIQDIQNQLASITIPALTLSQESLAECLIAHHFWNFFPRVRYSERPDVACANIYEGKILLIVDNSPAVMILPTSFFDFVQEANDFYFPPVIGTYLRWVRIFVFALTLLLTPLWYLYIQNSAIFPEWLNFLKIAQINSIPIIIQLLIIEFLVDTIKLASLNTPSALSGSFGVVGALVLGEFAIKAHLFVPEVLLYMAFVSLANFTQPSYELGYALKIWRILLLLCICFFNIIGFLIGILAMFFMLFFTPTILHHNYLFPFIPFDIKKIKELFIRVPINSNNT